MPQFAVIYVGDFKHNLGRIETLHRKTVFTIITLLFAELIRVEESISCIPENGTYMTPRSKL